MVVDVRNFNLICDFTESGESGFSTTYCGYPKLPLVLGERVYWLGETCCRFVQRWSPDEV